MTYDDLLAEVRGLRLLRDKAEARMFLRLVTIENDSVHMQTLIDGGVTSFGWFVEECGTKAARYESFKVGLEKLDCETALEIGADATIVAGQLRSEPAKYTHAVHCWSNDHGGALPTRDTAKRILMQVDPRSETPRSVSRAARRDDELAKLRAENADLRAANKSLRRKVSKLERMCSSMVRPGPQQPSA